MSAKSQQTSPRTLEEINKQIIEIKKKIQLSEGQRKAAFEEYESERKINVDQILKLKKEIKELTVVLQKNKDDNAANRIQDTRLEAIVGPLENKTTGQVKDALDLRVIDRQKQLDLIQYKLKKRRAQLEALAQEYQQLLSKKPKEEVIAKINNLFKEEEPEKKKPTKKKKSKTVKKDEEAELVNPYKKKFYVLQNNIHRIEVQAKEAEHMRNSYKTIRNSLLNDRSKFESSLQNLEEKLSAQQKDIKELQRMNAEAANARTAARLSLDREERASMSSARVRERQAAEKEALVTEKKAELERLERKIFQSVKSGGPQPPGSTTGVDDADKDEDRNDLEEDNLEKGEESSTSDKENKEEDIKQIFEILKEATGATSYEEVYIKYKTQLDTRNRLDYLKNTTEAEKKQLELKQHALNMELERHKYAQERDKEKYGENLINLKNDIEKYELETAEIIAQTEDKSALLCTICKTLHTLYLSLKDVGVKPQKDITADPDDSNRLIETLNKELENLVSRSTVEEEKLEENEEIVETIKENKEGVQEEVILEEDNEMYPHLYNTLLRQPSGQVEENPLHISTQPAIEDEEEVPSRGFLKRQAQLVVDAKSKRKTLRIPIRK